jgi:digeranylgeranylglycerophospholipid reductase
LSSRHFDVVVGGGSVGGLSFATEAASKGLAVLVLEEDKQMGEPEKCDGLVSRKALDAYIAPDPGCVQSRVKSGTIYSPSGVSVSLDASRLEVIVIDRSAYEEQLAASALSRGATIRTGTRVTGVSAEKGVEKATVTATGPTSSSESYTCSYYIDATGPSSVVSRNRSGLIPAAK